MRESFYRNRDSQAVAKKQLKFNTTFLSCHHTVEGEWANIYGPKRDLRVRISQQFRHSTVFCDGSKDSRAILYSVRLSCLARGSIHFSGCIQGSVLPHGEQDIRLAFYFNGDV